MTKISNRIQMLVNKVDRRSLQNNTQRALLSLLTSKEEWVSRASLRIPSVSARLRDLRKEEFGGFDVECRSLADLNAAAPKEGRSLVRAKDPRSTFYRLNPRSITLGRVQKVFGEGVVAI